ncbi:hypothetical protein [Paeniglutamicibacter cryotolerans]|uniref:Uncharacterized protein n=2 Tax=Paeniglutamicibacter cryotolerans TaxID=670079 RepID=A0A839QDU8_9MICC|nr:hypothetical protein [Paeniglutamicibacter cryotolerans]
MGEIVEVTMRLEWHFSRHDAPGAPGAVDWARKRIRGAADATGLREGARAGLDALRGGMGSLTDFFVGKGPADYAMIAGSWDRLRGALRSLPYQPPVTGVSENVVVLASSRWVKPKVASI